MGLKRFDFNRGNPDPATFPVEELQRAADMAFSGPDFKMLQYGSYFGYQPLREWLADFYGIDSEQIVLTNSSLEGLDYVSRSLIPDDSCILVESPSYDRALTLLRANGCKVYGVDMDSDGPDIEMLSNLLQRLNVGAFYTVPDFQNPTGFTTSFEKRKEIGRLADRHGFTIVEDSPYKALRYTGEDIPSYYEIAPEQTLHVSSFSKVVSPGLRVSFLFGPAKKIKSIQEISERSCLHSGNVSAAILHQYLRQGCFEKNLKKTKSIYSKRLAIMNNAIYCFIPSDVGYQRPEGGFFCSLFIPGCRNNNLMRCAKEHNFKIPDPDIFFITPHQKAFIRLPFTYQSDAMIPEAIERLSLVIEQARR